MSCVSAGRRRCGMVCPHWRVTSLRMGMRQRGSWRISIIAAVRPALLVVLPITRIFHLASWIPSPATSRSGGGSTPRRGRLTIDSWVERQTGHWYDLIPRSKEHLKNADAINDAFLRWLGKQPRNGRPFFAFLNYNDAHSPYEVPDKSIPGFGLRPASSRERQTLQGFTGIDKTTLSIDDVQMATDVYDDCIAYLDRRLGLLLDELSRQGSAREYAGDRDFRSRRAPGRSRVVLPRLQFVPAARAGAVIDRG